MSASAEKYLAEIHNYEIMAVVYMINIDWVQFRLCFYITCNNYLVIMVKWISATVVFRLLTSLEPQWLNPIFRSTTAS